MMFSIYDYLMSYQSTRELTVTKRVKTISKAIRIMPKRVDSWTTDGRPSRDLAECRVFKKGYCYRRFCSEGGKRKKEKNSVYAVGSLA